MFIHQTVRRNRSEFKIKRVVGDYDRHYLARIGVLKFASSPVVYYFAIKDSVYNPKLRNLQELEDTISGLTVNDIQIKDSLNIVYVIGESLTRSKSSLFGYASTANSPMLLKEKDAGSLFIFDNLISETHQTVGIVPFMMSTCSITDAEAFNKYPLLAAILKKDGYYVGYFDNQSVMGSSNFDFGCAFFFAREYVRAKSLDEYNDRVFEYDGDMIEAFPVAYGKSKSFTIYHIMGNHLEASQRYPKEFDKFKPADYDGMGYTQKQAKKVAEYDNATLYNDFVLSRIIEPLRNKTAIVVYASDHGDEVYDYAGRDHRGRDLDVTMETARVFCEVPAMIWVSEKYKAAYPEEVEMLRRNIHKPLYNSDLVHTIIDMAGISTATFKPGLSLIREGGGRTDRVIQHRIHYDRDRKKIDSYKMRYE